MNRFGHDVDMAGTIFLQYFLFARALWSVGETCWFWRQLDGRKTQRPPPGRMFFLSRYPTSKLLGNDEFIVWKIKFRGSTCLVLRMFTYFWYTYSMQYEKCRFNSGSPTENMYDNPGGDDCILGRGGEAKVLCINPQKADSIPSSSISVYIWNQVPSCQYIRQLDLWFQIYWKMRDQYQVSYPIIEVDKKIFLQGMSPSNLISWEEISTIYSRYGLLMIIMGQLTHWRVLSLIFFPGFTGLVYLPAWMVDFYPGFICS